jgi:hypothetical protein
LAGSVLAKLLFQGVSYQFNPAGVQWFNSNAFVNPQPGTYGTTGRNAYIGPGYGSVELSAVNKIPIKQRLHAQFRCRNIQPLQPHKSGSAGSIRWQRIGCEL